MTTASAQIKDGLSFGPFHLVASERLLTEAGVPIELGSRALDILVTLISRPNEIVTKKDLISQVWPDVFVEESSLRFQMATLRKALRDGKDGARYITTLPGRGYCFVAPVSRISAPPPESGRPADTVAASSHSLPARLNRMIGRDESVVKIADELRAERFVTVVGPGGIGKTTVAVTVAHSLLAAFGGAVHFLDLSSLRDTHLATSALASTLGVAVSSDDPVPGLLALLKDKRMLLVLDSCEYVIETVSSLVERIYKEAPQIHILATSRESLRADGEHVHRLFPLSSPPKDAKNLTASAVLAFPAAQLFMERASAGASGLALSDADAGFVADICLKLDGIPLAIELVAGRVGAFGVQGIAALLDERFALLWQGRRTALPRHQTLSATLDWSYDLLSERERVVLGGLGVFVGPFSLEAAQTVLADDDLDAAQIVDCIGDLVAKSLVASEIGTAPTRYRLLDTTRAYVLAKPVDRGRADALSRRHAIYYCQCLDRIDDAAPRTEIYEQARIFLGNVRAGLEWGFSDRGDPEVGVALAAASAEFFLEMSLLTEYLRWAERAIAVLDRYVIGMRREMGLRAAFAVSSMFTRGNREEVRLAFLKSLELAETLADPLYQLRILSGLHIFMTRIGDHRGALGMGEKSAIVAKALGDRPSIMMAEWMIGVAEHLLGNQAAAMKFCKSAMAPGSIPRWGNAGHLGYDRRIIALVSYTRALWLGGYPGQALAAAHYTINEAKALGHPLTICIALIWTIYPFLWTGDWHSAEDIVDELIDHAEKHFLGPYQAVGYGLRGKLLLERGDTATGIKLIRDCLETLQTSRHHILTTVFASNLAQGLTAVGQPGEALAIIDGAVAQIGNSGDTFDAPEAVRIKGVVLMALDRLPEAERCLLLSLEWARKQSAPGWELRAAIVLAQLWFQTGRAAEGVALLQPLYAGFTEGFETADMVAAKRLLDNLASAGKA